ncbi:MAG: serine hydrolase [Aquimonas sp.]|nr:serine hydrolase [Aquimonas sp.]
MRSITALLMAPLLVFALPAASAPPPSADVARFAEAALTENCALDAPGMAVLIARGDEVLFRGACGRASLELELPLSADHVFRLASVTKQFAAAGLLRLVDEGRLSLDDPLSKWLPDYPNAEAITLAMLLNHTSGIRSYTDMPEIMSGTGIMQDLSTVQLVDSFKSADPDFAPGEGWHYNNSGYVLVGAVIEAATGMRWDAYLRQAFFEPLGMVQTRGGHDAATAVIPGLVSGYRRVGEQWAPMRYLSMSQPHAAGALLSSVDDLLKWNRALHGGSLLSPESYRAMITPAGPAADSQYGYGIVAASVRDEPVLQHGGGIFGFSTYLLYVPEQQITTAVLFNADGGRPGMLGSGRFASYLTAYALGKPYPPKTPIEMEESALREFEGVYRIDETSARVLRISEGRLTSQRTGGQPFALIPVDTDTFALEDGFSRIVFERGGDGTVEAMRFYPEGEGPGERVLRSEESPPAQREAMQLPRAALERVAGEYAREGMVLRILVEGETARAQLGAQPAFELFAESPTRFFLKVVDASLEFLPADGQPKTVTLRQGGAELVYTRME